MKRLFVNIILLIVALLLLLTIGLFGLVYQFYYSLKHFAKSSFIRYWTNIIYAVNVGIDQIGNVLLSAFLNRFCVKNKQLHPFGIVTETISYALAINYFAGNLTKYGLALVRVIEFFDKNHMSKSL